MAFLSGSFTGSSAKWSIPEKEGFAVVESMGKLDYLLHGRQVTIFTDHANLVYLFDPFGQNPGIARHTACKLMRWALKLCAYRYVIEHVAGDKNVWADILTRWAVTPNPLNNVSLKALILAPIAPSFDETMDWPSMVDIRKEQEKSDEEVPNRFNIKEQILQDPEGIVYVPTTGLKLQLRIMVAGHTGLSGHRGYSTTAKQIKSHFWWKNMDKNIEEFCKSCLHCLATYTGEIISRPLGHSMHADRPNEILHFDFCYLTPGEMGYEYVLILKDDFSGFVWLVPATNADADTTADALLNWFSSFGTTPQWVSDQGSHFKNQVVRSLRERTNSRHHFTIPYTPWTNGTVEVVCRELLRAVRALVSEFQIPLRAWKSVIPVVQSVLNNTILSRLGNRCPLTAFTGLPQDSPLAAIKVQTRRSQTIKSLDDIRSKQLIQLESLIDSLDKMHKDVKLKSDKKREKAVEQHNRKTGIRAVNFNVGDFVLRARTRKDRGSKISVRWYGPYRVIACKSDYLFTIEDLLSREHFEVHGRRLMFFRNKSYHLEEDLLNHLGYQNNELMVVSKFLKFRTKNGDIEVLTQWKGLEESENSWEAVGVMQEDVPGMFKRFLEETLESNSASQKHIAKSINF